MRNFPISLVLLAVLLSSCSLKEDRIDCPCVFSLDLSGCVIYDDVLTFSLWDDSEKIVSDYYYQSDLGQKYEYDLARRKYDASAVSGDVNSIHSGRNLLVKRGMQSDSLYAWNARLDATGETARSLIVLYKQFAVITFDMSEYESEGSSFSVKVRGNYGGLDILSLMPVENIFEYEFSTDGSNLYPVRIPRQGDDELSIEIVSNGNSVAKLAVGYDIRRAGYDWTNPDLKDITVTVPAAGTSIVLVEINEWLSEGMDGRF